MGTVILSSASNVAKTIFGSKVKKGNKIFKLHSISNKSKEALSEVVVQRLRKNETYTKTYLVHVIYIRPKGNVRSFTKLRKKKSRKRKR